MRMSLKAWLSLATPDQKKTLASRARTSIQTIAQIASGFRGGSADAAVRLSEASDGEIAMGSVCSACRRCPHYKTSRK